MKTKLLLLYSIVKYISHIETMMAEIMVYGLNLKVGVAYIGNFSNRIRAGIGIHVP